MAPRSLFALAAGCLLCGPALAGPCTDRIVQIEKAVTARFEGSGPALTGSVQSSTTSPGTQPAGSASSAAPDGTTSRSLQSQDESQAINRLHQAKVLDKAGQEGE